MNFDRDLVFSYIEEDNMQRAYFRVRPILTVHGDVQEEAAKLWPDDGCLRVVPDRNEQHTFKDRMRTLGGWCVMNLTVFPADANKIRTNKNYRPENGERNQFILYSDAVQALPEHTFFEVLPGKAEDFASLAKSAVTPLFYIRQEDTLLGPIHKAAPEKPAPAEEAAGTLFPVTCPDGAQRTILCIEPAPAQKQSENAAAVSDDSPLPIGKPLNILDESKDFEETLHQLDQPLSKGANLLHRSDPASAISAPAPQSLSGTPLFRSPIRTALPQPKNKLQEVVSSQWRVARNEPPADPLPVGATMHHVANPVEIACQGMKAAWQVPEAHTQLIDFLLSLDGMRAKLEPRLSETAGETALQHVLQSRLQDMEAERLSTLFQLDKAKEDLEGFRRSVAASLKEKARAENAKDSEIQSAHKSSMEELKAQINALITQRDELQSRLDALRQDEYPAALSKALADAQLAMPVNGIPLRMSGVSGSQTDPEEIIQRVMNACQSSGLTLRRNHVVAMLVLLAVSPRIGIATATPGAAATLMRNIALSLGWIKGFAHQVTPEQKPLVSALPVESTPVVLLTSLAAYAPIDSLTKVMLSQTVAPLTRNVAYASCSWPIVSLPALPFMKELPETHSGAPVSMASLKTMAERSGATDAEIDQVLSALFQQIAPLSGASSRELHHFVSACAAMMEGGLAAACDWAILLWILPALERNAKTIAAVKPLLEEYPLSLSRWQS